MYKQTSLLHILLGISSCIKDSYCASVQWLRTCGTEPVNCVDMWIGPQQEQEDCKVVSVSSDRKCMSDGSNVHSVVIIMHILQQGSHKKGVSPVIANQVKSVMNM